MLCDDCVRDLYFNLSPAAAKILKLLVKGNSDNDKSYNQMEIIKLTGLTISTARDALNELRGSMLVNVKTRGRGFYYSVSESVLVSTVYLEGSLTK